MLSFKLAWIIKKVCKNVKEGESATSVIKKNNQKFESPKPQLNWKGPKTLKVWTKFTVTKGGNFSYVQTLEAVVCSKRV